MSLRDTFTTVYRERHWSSGQSTPFDSGSGSASMYAALYCELVNSFIKERQVHTVVDLGCGDFRIGSEIAACGVNYVGIDIVPDLVSHLRNQFEDQRVNFECLDATVDSLPVGDLVLVRQVLQHLTNRQIQSVLERLGQYKYAIVTESVALGKNIIPNRDKIHGPDIRLYSSSGVFLDKPPFNLPVDELLRVPVSPHEVIVTTLIRRHNSVRRDPFIREG